MHSVINLGDREFCIRKSIPPPINPLACRELGGNGPCPEPKDDLRLAINEISLSILHSLNVTFQPKTSSHISLIMPVDKQNPPQKYHGKSCFSCAAATRGYLWLTCQLGFLTSFRARTGNCLPRIYVPSLLSCSC